MTTERENSKARRIVIILLDAFSSKYLNPEFCPFLCEISQGGFSLNLEPMFSFEGISASILTGTTPNTNKIWLDYVFRSRGSTPRLFKQLVKMLDTIPNDDVSKYLRFMVHKVFRQPIATPNLIPSNLLHFFEPMVKGHGTSLGEISTLFDQLDKYGLKYYVSGLFGALPDRFVVWNFLRKSSADCELFVLKVTSLDKLGHRYGPESQEVHKKVLQFDKMLARVIKKFSDSRRSLCFIIFSDHGMSPVWRCINFLGLLEKLPYKMPDDYLLFLSSTVANFRFFSLEAKKAIVDLLRNANFGKVLTVPELVELGIDKIGMQYGELFFVLNEGGVFFPDFYRKTTPPRGMHGYFHSTYDTPILVVHTNLPARLNRNRTVQYIDIMPTVLDLLGVPIPKTVEGESLLVKR